MHVEKAEWSLSHGLTDASSSFPLFCKCFSGIRCVPEVMLELEGETLASTHLYWEEGSHLNSAPQHPPPYVNIYAYILLSFPSPFLPRGKRPLTAPCSSLLHAPPPQTSGSISFLVSWLAICIFYEAIPRIAPSLPCSPPSRYVTADFIPYAMLNSLPYPLFFHGSLLCL